MALCTFEVAPGLMPLIGTPRGPADPGAGLAGGDEGGKEGEKEDESRLEDGG